MKWAALIFLAVSACAQTNGFAPSLVQSDSYQIQGNSTSPVTVPFLDNVTSGNLLVYCAGWTNHDAMSVSAADTLGTSLTGTSTLSVAGASDSNLKCFYGSAPSSGANTLTLTFGSTTPLNIQIAEYANISATLDTSCTNTTIATAASVTTSCTSTVNGDLAVSYSDGWVSSGNEFCSGSTSSPSLQFAAGAGANHTTVMCWDIAGAAGSYGATITQNVQSGASANWGMMTLMFKPSGITVTTSKLPDGAQTTAYKVCLFAVGGAGAYTWSATAGLPGWATVDSLTTGCPAGATGRITGTPNANATGSVTLQVTDGTHTITRSLSLTTGSSFQTPTLVQFKQLGTGPLSFPSPVHQNDLIIVDIWGRETGGSNNWIPSASGSNNLLSDTLNSPFVRITPLVQIPGSNNGANGAPIVRYAAIATTCGADTISFAVNDLAGNTGQAPMAIEEWSGVQGVIDPGSSGQAAGFSSSSVSTTTGNYTAQVANETLTGLGTEGVTNTPALNLTTAIFANQSGSLDMVSAYQNVTTATTYTTTLSATSPLQASDALQVMLNGLRPGLNAPLCTNLAPSFEKYHRAVW